jgi:hypothetical protein
VRIFRKEPGIALKSGVFAAVVSWVIVAIPSMPECLSDQGACLLVSPAVWLYWAPLFVVSWAIAAAAAVAIRRGKTGQ